MKIALVCPTIGQTRRGYERFFADLFHLLRGDIDIILFKGAGTSNKSEMVVPHIKRTGVLSYIFPNRLLYFRYRLEFASFAIAILPYLTSGGFDVVHFIDPPLAAPLFRSRQLLARRYALLFTNAGPVSYDTSRWVDHIHYLSPGALEDGRGHGVPSDRSTMLPIGVDPQRTICPFDRPRLRNRFGIGDTTFVILAITTLNRGHKRIDHLIEEVSKLKGDFLLWIDGGLQPDGDPSLLEMAKRKLGKHFRHTHVSSGQIAELLKVADLMVSTAVQESFGMAIVEALCSGLPTIVHDSPHFRWLAGGSAHFLDMRIPGALSDRIQQFLLHTDCLLYPDPEATLQRFGWPNLVPGYLELYQHSVASARRR